MLVLLTLLLHLSSPRTPFTRSAHPLLLEQPRKLRSRKRIGYQHQVLHIQNQLGAISSELLDQCFAWLRSRITSLRLLRALRNETQLQSFYSLSQLLVLQARPSIGMSLFIPSTPTTCQQVSLSFRRRRGGRKIPGF